MRLKTLATLLLASSLSYALTVDMVNLETKNKIGTVEIKETKYGVEFKPNLEGLPPGLHGFHVHEHGSIESTVDKKTGKSVKGGAAGGHYDPENTKKHGLPWEDDSHKGDLPALYVDSTGVAQQPVLSSRLSLDEIKGKSLMIHMHGDNHSDTPSPLGGGGGRIAAGIIPTN
ncbi:superoxide dismutase family protein [Cetobacterium sp.]